MIGTVAGAVQKTVSAHWQSLLPVAAALGILSALIDALSSRRSEEFLADVEAGNPVDLGGFLGGALLGVLIVFVVNLVLNAVLFNMIAGAHETGTADAGYGLRRTLERIGPLIALVLISAVLVGLGFLLFIIPGIYLVVVFSPAVAVLFLENKGAIETLSRSRALVSPRFWDVFVVLLAIIVAAIVLSVIMSVFGFFGSIISATALGIVGQAVIYHVYQELVSTPAEGL